MVHLLLSVQSRNVNISLNYSDAQISGGGSAAGGPPLDVLLFPCGSRSFSSWRKQTNYSTGLHYGRKNELLAGRVGSLISHGVL